jgi:hypothetical protein
MASAEQAQSAPAGAAMGGIWEWFWRGRTLAAAKAGTRISALGRERLRRARLAAELADRASDPADPLRAGSSLPLALSLYREAAYWALLAHSKDASAANLSEAFAAVSDVASRARCSADDLATVRKALVEKSFIETADDAMDVLSKDVETCQVFVHALLDGDLDRDEHVASVLFQRWLRVGAVVLVACVGLYFAKGSIESIVNGPDYALGKPWRASSKGYECHPAETECGGARTAIFFHTQEEENPWVEIDLGKPESFSRIEVTNREDCCPERAVPMIVEVGDDRQHWTEVAKRTETFRVWEAKFKTVKARYVRLRVPRYTALHLVKVAVRS